MTIAITFFSKNEIVLISDQYRYSLNDDVLKEVLSHKLEITHENFEQSVQTIERDAPKIFRFGKNTGIIAAGDCRFSSILTTLNKRGNIIKQILEQLKQKKLGGFWSCRIGKYNVKKEKAEMVSITYENGQVNITEHDRDTIGFDSFSPEMKDIFFKKYATIFYIGNTKEKTMVVKEFFAEISALYNNKAGGQAVIAKIDKDGFAWITKPKPSYCQNFTTYAYNWMPEKIETTATTEYAWSDQTFTVVLELSFECESTMLLFISAFAAGQIKNVSLADWSMCLANFHLKIDGTFVATTEALLGAPLQQGKKFLAPYSTHSVAILPKGSHTLQLCMRAEYSGTTGYCTSRRLTIMKGFYQGGTT
jgi:hypothetical protein